MKKIFSFILFYLCTIYSQPVPEYFYKRLEGSIDNKYNITVNLTRTDSALTGNYYYNKKGELIKLVRSSVDSTGKVYLEEDAGYKDDYTPVTSGTFKGKFILENKIEGTWEKPGSGKTLPFYLEEKYPEGSAKFEVSKKSKSYNKWGSASINVSLIEMKSYNDENILAKINLELNKNLLGNSISSEDSGGYDSVDEMLNDFIESYVEEIVSDSASYDEFVPQYEYGNNTEILFNSNYLFSIRNIAFVYLGGAHPNTFITLKSYNLKTGDPVKLTDIFKPGYTIKLDKAGENKFREFYKLTASEPLDSAGFWFESGFKLNDNFTLTQSGITFLFNQYEVGPYAIGSPEVYIPFNEIKDLLKEDSIIGLLK